MNNYYNNKKCLVTGGTGLLGTPLVKMLIERGAIVSIASLDDPALAPREIPFFQVDLTEYTNCLKVCKGQDIVFNCIGTKGSPKLCATKPASFMVPQTLFSLNMMRAARDCNVEKYLLCSSVGVYAPSEEFFEDSVFDTICSKNDFYAGSSKRLLELQASAYSIEYNWNAVSIVRPTSLYGPFDNFDPDSAMVISSLIARIEAGEAPLRVWGTGNAKRDFLFAEDCAGGMLHMIENGITQPVNLGSGLSVSIKELVDVIKKYTNPNLEIIWDITKITGDNTRIMNINRARSFGWEPKTSLDEGIKKTIEWYKENKHLTNKRYNVFNGK